MHAQRGQRRNGPRGGFAGLQRRCAIGPGKIGANTDQDHENLFRFGYFIFLSYGTS
jgi:hypothetical protein